MCTSHDVTNNTTSATSRDGYALVPNWPQYPPDMAFEMGSGVAVDAAGVIYLFTRDIEHWAAHPLAMRDKMGKSSISMFSRDGDYLGKWGPSDERGFSLGAHTLYIEHDGMFWTTDRDGHTVKKYTPQGELLLTLGTFGEWGCDATHFNTPHALAIDSQGRLLVADLCGGNFHDYMTLPGQIEPHRTQPEEGCVHRIQILDAHGCYIDEWAHVTPLSIATYGDKIYSSDKMSNLLVLNEDGEVLSRVDDIAIYIHQLAVDARGDLYTASVYPEHAGELRGRRVHHTDAGPEIL